MRRRGSSFVVLICLALVSIAFLMGPPCRAVERLVPTQYATIQTAINASSNGDTVVITRGTYSGSGNRGVMFMGKAITVRSTDPNDPNVVAATIVDAGLANNCFVFCVGEGPGSVLAGLTLQRGKTSLSGGAITCAASNPTITRCVISGCTGSYGGAIANLTASPTVTWCTFQGNRSANGGGAVFDFSGSNPTISDCTFSNNGTSRNGGAIHDWMNCSPAISRCTFTGNAALGPNQTGCGGAISCLSACNATIRYCTFVGNSSTFGGAIATTESSPTVSYCTFSGNVGVHGGVMDNTNYGNPTITWCTFTGNSSHWGGALDDWTCSATVTHCLFVGNTATGGGGGMVNFGGGDLIMTGCVFTGNAAVGSQGGALSSNDSNTAVSNCLFAGNTADLGGGAVACGDSNIVLRNCTLVGNASASTGGGICDFGGDHLSLANCTIVGNQSSNGGGGVFLIGNAPSLVNSILWANLAPTGPQIAASDFVGPYSVPMSYCDVQGGPNAMSLDPNCTLIWGEGNIDADPIFAGALSSTWTAAGVYDPNTFQIRFTDATAHWTDGELVGTLINPDTSQARPLQFLIAANTATTVTIWADAATVGAGSSQVAAGARYQFYDYRLQLGSPCINAGDPNGNYAGQTDIEGDPRVASLAADMGSDEYDGPVAYYSLNLEIVNGSMGTIAIEPDLPVYSTGTVVRLTAQPNPGKAFKEWTIYDPNYPGAANRAITDANASIEITMSADREVTASFKCGDSMSQVLPLLAGLGLLGLAKRRGKGAGHPSTRA